jgi:alkylation response protein AidB-like acyl-CoA dehydrogenase
MDFAFTEAQIAVAALARKIFEARLTPAAMKTAEASPQGFDRELWCLLGSTGLLGTAVPEAYGGAGHGFLELCALLEEAGAAVAPLPIWSTAVLGALPIGEFGTDEQRARFLPGVARGSVVLSAARAAPHRGETQRVRTTARAQGDAWMLDGVKTCVPALAVAERVLVPAATGPDSLGVFLVDPRAEGVRIEPQTTTAGESQYRITMDGAAVPRSDALGDPSLGKDVLAWLLPRATVALCAMELGVAERALRMTAAYTSTRHQFERPIATFQAVSQRAADAYIDVESIRVTTWQAAWRLSSGLPADEAVSIAKYFAAEAGHRVVYAAQHLHAGTGFDLEYPLHRYYLWSKQIELTLGSASEHLALLGRFVAAG